jgi:hypothetical protein
MAIKGDSDLHKQSSFPKIPNKKLSEKIHAFIITDTHEMDLFRIHAIIKANKQIRKKKITTSNRLAKNSTLTKAAKMIYMGVDPI